MLHVGTCFKRVRQLSVQALRDVSAAMILKAQVLELRKQILTQILHQKKIKKLTTVSPNHNTPIL